MSKILIGTDIEMMPAFLAATNIDDVSKARQMEELFQNLPRKEAPEEIHTGVMLHNDNLFVEFTTPPVAAKDVRDAIRTARAEVERFTGLSLLPGCGFFLTDSLMRAFEQFAPTVMEQISTFGCSPDFVVDMKLREGVERAVPERVLASAAREMGGHIHVDAPDNLLSMPEYVVHLIQMYLDTNRRGLFTEGLHVNLGGDEVTYQQAGVPQWYRMPYLYRPKSYGVEYRSLSSDMLLSLKTQDFVGIANAIEAGGKEV